MSTAPLTGATSADELARSTKRLNDRSRRARRAVRSAAKGHSIVEAVVEAWCVLEAEQHKLALAHNAAEHGDDEDLIEAADAAWQPALDAMAAAAIAIRGLPVTTAAEAIAKHQAFLVTKSVHDDDDANGHIAALQRDLAALAAQPPGPAAPDGSSAWDTALTEYRRRRAIVDAINIADDKDKDKDDDEAWAAAHRHSDQALRQLMDTPAPTIRALAEKHLIARREVYAEDMIDLEDPASVAAAEACWQSYVDVRLAQDTLQLAGIEHPCVSIRFNPRSWIESYEALGGYVTSPTGKDIYISYPTGTDAERDEGRHLEAELHAEPWKQQAVITVAADRRAAGNDPRCHWDGSPRAPALIAAE